MARKALKQEKLFILNISLTVQACQMTLLYQIRWARDYCETRGIPILNVPEVEADDTMASVAVWAAQKGSRAYLCTSDKDMYQLVNDQILILNTFKENLIMEQRGGRSFWSSPKAKWWTILAITGDSF